MFCKKPKILVSHSVHHEFFEQVRLESCLATTEDGRCQLLNELFLSVSIPSNNSLEITTGFQAVGLNSIAVTEN